jgi:CCR4-NOT transcription complex subunit 2
VLLEDKALLTGEPKYIAVGPQSLRGLPNGFSNQQQQLPQNRNVSGRLPQGAKMGMDPPSALCQQMAVADVLVLTSTIASNGATWAFGGGVPMGNTGLPASRPNNGPVTSFAQTIGASSQSAAPLDLS